MRKVPLVYLLARLGGVQLWLITLRHHRAGARALVGRCSHHGAMLATFLQFWSSASEPLDAQVMTLALS